MSLMAEAIVREKCLLMQMQPLEERKIKSILEIRSSDKFICQNCWIKLECRAAFEQEQ